MSRNIKQYDGKCVRIIDRWGTVLDGICMFNSVDYSEHEFGRREEALQIENYIIYKRQIKQVIVLEENSGPYSPFLDAYGELEEDALREGMVLTEDILLSEENVHSLRMMNCINAHIDKGELDKLPPAEELIKTLNELVKYNQDGDIQREGKRLLEKLSSLG
jgi:hypothetical protein